MWVNFNRSWTFFSSQFPEGFKTPVQNIKLEILKRILNFNKILDSYFFLNHCQMYGCHVNKPKGYEDCY
jgi:hypothetical protein